MIGVDVLDPSNRPIGWTVAEVTDGSDEDPEVGAFRIGPDEWRRTRAEEEER